MGFTLMPHPCTPKALCLDTPCYRSQAPQAPHPAPTTAIPQSPPQNPTPLPSRAPTTHTTPPHPHSPSPAQPTPPDPTPPHRPNPPHPTTAPQLSGLETPSHPSPTLALSQPAQPHPSTREGVGLGKVGKLENIEKPSVFMFFNGFFMVFLWIFYGFFLWIFSVFFYGWAYEKKLARKLFMVFLWFYL